jgi:glycosyltransferase involved in cell wall biosynthesis
MKLLVVGDGSERRALQKFASRTLYADRIEFAGATSTPEAFLARMDIFALSSDTEQMPLSVLEAMAIGLPVVAFNVGDLPFMVAPENVPMVSISLTEPALYTETLLRLVRDPELRAHIGRANREAAASRFNERIMARAYERLFG